MFHKIISSSNINQQLQYGQLRTNELFGKGNDKFGFENIRRMKRRRDYMRTLDIVKNNTCTGFEHKKNDITSNNDNVTFYDAKQYVCSTQWPNDDNVNNDENQKEVKEHGVDQTHVSIIKLGPLKSFGGYDWTSTTGREFEIG
eukprot:Awhi_evm1s14688